ncbi:MAG: thioredoxin [Acidobacteria bacterium]|nr:thioredoxin [Acidobacteriota bacterium]
MNTRRGETDVESSFEHDILESPVPVLVDFWAPWCGPCRIQLPILEEITRGEAESARVIKVNVDEQPELAGRFGIASIPTLLVFSNGRVHRRFVGVQSAATLRSALRAAAAQQGIGEDSTPDSRH